MNTTGRERIRSHLLTTRRNLHEQDVLTASLNIVDAVVETVQGRVGHSSRTIASYLPVRGEIDPRPTVSALLNSGWKVVLPVCGDDGHMDFCPWEPGDPLVANRYGIDEPSTDAINVSDIDVVIVPAVAFDRRGNRLGHGVGFYDRFFSRCAQQSHVPYRLGIGYDFQIVELPTPEPWDIPVHSVVSPSEVIDNKPCEY